MLLQKPTFQIVDHNHVLRTIESGARVCYKSEDKIKPGSDVEIISKLKTFKHESVLEHGVITVKFVMDRGVSHEQVRHRLSSPSQESTRYCNYAKDKFEGGIRVIDPFFFDSEATRRSVSVPVLNQEASVSKGVVTKRVPAVLNAFDVWVIAMLTAEWAYLTLINEFGHTPQEARSVLPNSLKTEMQITANVREWRTILAQRTHRDAHPQMRQIMVPLAKALAKRWPCLFEEFASEEHPSPATEIPSPPSEE